MILGVIFAVKGTPKYHHECSHGITRNKKIAVYFGFGKKSFFNVMEISRSVPGNSERIQISLITPKKISQTKHRWLVPSSQNESLRNSR